MILSETHLHQLLRGYVTYYNAVRPHQALDTTLPDPERYSRPRSGVWSQPRRLAGSITSTSARPDPSRSVRPAPLARSRHSPPTRGGMS
jgi:hypothetical protein